MKVSFVRRRKWVLEGSPSVAEVLETFACFRKTRYVS